MMAAVLNKYLLQILAGVLLVAVMGATVQTFLVRSVRAERDQALIERSVALSANEALREALAQLQAEKDLSERLLAERMKVEARIRDESRARLDQKDRELARLRDRYADVEAFLAMPVPPAFVDAWMRGPAGGDQN